VRSTVKQSATLCPAPDRSPCGPSAACRATA
jgi:hypothetical protein